MKTKRTNNVSLEELEMVHGGGVNNWQTNVLQGGGAAYSGWAIGSTLCGPVCGYTGAKVAVSLWAGVTGATGGFKKR